MGGRGLRVEKEWVLDARRASAVLITAFVLHPDYGKN